MYTLRQILTAMVAAIVMAVVTGYPTLFAASAVGIHEPFNLVLAFVVAVSAATVTLVRLYPRNEFDV